MNSIPFIVSSTVQPRYGRGHVDRHIDRLQLAGVKSVILLMDHRDVEAYAVPGGLVSYYREQAGMAAELIPIARPARSGLPARQAGELWQTFLRMRKPVAIVRDRRLAMPGRVMSYMRAQLKDFHACGPETWMCFDNIDDLRHDYPTFAHGRERDIDPGAVPIEGGCAFDLCVYFAGYFAIFDYPKALRFVDVCRKICARHTPGFLTPVSNAYCHMVMNLIAIGAFDLAIDTLALMDQSYGNDDATYVRAAIERWPDAVSPEKLQVLADAGRRLATKGVSPHCCIVRPNQSAL